MNYRIFENKNTGICRIKHDESWVQYTDLAGLEAEDNARAHHIIREWENAHAAMNWIREISQNDNEWEEIYEQTSG